MEPNVCTHVVCFTILCFFLLYGNTHTFTSLIKDCIKGYTNGEIGDKRSIILWLQNQTPVYAVYRDPPQTKGHIRVKVKCWKRHFMQTETKRKQKIAILISDKINIEIKNVE